MKTVLVSQRVDVIIDYEERRDALDQRWSSFLLDIGVVGVPLPNNPEAIASILDSACFEGILLTGGNSPVLYGGNAPERDATDELLIDYAEATGVPLVGVCRGFQSLALYYGGVLSSIKGHVAFRHSVSGEMQREVNSYHTLAARELPPKLVVKAQADDGTVEALAHITKPIIGMMWHPEREAPFNTQDKCLFMQLWNNERVEWK